MDHQIDWIVSQIGAREHYAVARAFHRRGHLKRLYTEFWSGRATPLLRGMGTRAATLTHRFHAELPADRVRSFNLSSALLLSREWLHGKPTGKTEAYRRYERIGRRFALDVNRALDRESLDPNTCAAFLYSTGALETCERLKSARIPIIVDQLDPARLDEQSVLAEMEKYPGWEASTGRVPESYYQRLAREWELADLVLVNSGWSRQNLINEKVDPAKIVVVPLCYEPEQTVVSLPVNNADRPLTVLWIGQIILRKGIQYLFEAARRMQASRVRFIVAGHVGISTEALKSAPDNLRILGKVSRVKAVELFSTADVFVLPTVSDGFALTQLEAMSFGLPVITTPHCGEVVTDGVDGFVLPYGDVDALVDKIEQLDKDRTLLKYMREHAVKKPREHRFSLDGYADAVEQAVQRLRGHELSQ
jgi:glycosyltransferase involved in cell wall biosynthesis